MLQMIGANLLFAIFQRQIVEIQVVNLRNFSSAKFIMASWNFPRKFSLVFYNNFSMKISKSYLLKIFSLFIRNVFISTIKMEEFLMKIKIYFGFNLNPFLFAVFKKLGERQGRSPKFNFDFNIIRNVHLTVCPYFSICSSMYVCLFLTVSLSLRLSIYLSIH